ncbi:DUF2935 domain-containing protein [Bacillus sp. 31A1R]|uniref:DUF2935 domain-containing protein n=1 Tax=Robertmurraya mangrovi TaxID=3098077 RepID=A0ABU5J3S9_9BACI|nr:DUF2935 domain-containing protein [Bacillus sp. 31A1R]MDZ5473986.1 DUF2935 domain-containing protein [Bacillus sp. 31A1R]
MAYVPINPLEEHQFWLEILEDHAYFIRDYLSPAETVWVNQAQQFIYWFQQVQRELANLRPGMALNSQEMINFAKRAYEVSSQYYLFEGHMLNLRLNNQVNLNLTPSYLNGTLSENREYLRILQHYIVGSDFEPLSFTALLDLWLQDQLGHVLLITRMLDGVEFDIIQQANVLRGEFSQHIVKNTAMKGYLLFAQQGFPIQIRFAHEVAASVVKFNLIVQRTIQLYKNNALINQSTLRFLEHHFPESCYFMKKLSYYAPQIEYPACGLSKKDYRQLK